MFLAIDAGNTTTVLGLLEGRPGSEPFETWRTATDLHRTGDEWLLQVRQFISWLGVGLDGLDGVVISSVVPRATTALQRMCERADLKPLMVSYRLDTGLDIGLDDPRELGADRIANAVAAFAAVGGPVIVVDMGTATTFDVVSRSCEYLGGVILPGLELGLDALIDRAAALRSFELLVPASVIGTSTISALQSGAIYGHGALLDGLVERIEDEIGPARVLATGGQSALPVSVASRVDRHDPWLTLKGLHYLWERNH